MMKYKAIIFDMDGTQASFVPGHSDSANYAGQAIIECTVRRGVIT